MKNSVHPYANTISTAGLSADALAKHISKNSDENLRLMFLEDDFRRSVAEGAGFILVRTTWCGDVWLSDIEIDALDQAEDQVLRQEVKIGTLHDFQLDEWLMMHERAYRHCHQANPPGPLDHVGRRNVFAGSDFRPEAAFTAISEDRIIAHASLRDTGDEWEFGWFGAATVEGITPRDLNLALKRREVAFADRLGLHTLYLERDSTDHQAMDVSTVLPIRKPEVWLTYQNRDCFEPIY